VQLVLLTDARANVSRDGRPGRDAAMQDALAQARRVREAGLPCLLVDTSPRPQPPARELAHALAARYVALPGGQSADIHAALQRGAR
jgi:magnesium chelatase subunit D